MYITPLVNKAIQPPKPVANFKVEHDGLNVRIHNLSNAHQGTWDFGDGSPLQAVTAENEFVTHTFPGPGEYTVKLTVHNILNEENDRTVVVKLDSAAAAAAKPQVTSFAAAPLSAGNIAPASFRVVAEVRNAKTCLWDLGDGRIDVVQDTAQREHFVSFTKSGRYTLKLVALNGTDHDEKMLEVIVTDPPPGVARAVVRVTDVGKRLEKRPVKPTTIFARFPQQQKENVFKFECHTKASLGGYAIADVRIPLAENREIRFGSKTDVLLDAALLGQKAARALRLTLSPDRQTLKLTGELVRDNLASPPVFALPLEILEQREVAAGPTEVQLATALGVPGSTFPSANTVALPPLPSDWTTSDRQVRVELDDGTVAVLQPTPLPTSSITTVAGRSVLFNATRVKDQVNVSLTSPGPR
jgi:PKD repeat protein